MAEVTAQQVKELRERTGVGMMDCKKALTETNGDFEQAIDWLRKKGLSNAAKKAGRVAAEGIVAGKVSHKKGVVLELNTETDFAAKNDKVSGLAKDLVNHLFEHTTNDVEAFKNSKIDGAAVNDKITSNIAVVGENMNLRRVASVEVSHGAVIMYVHNAISEGMGKIVVLLAIESQADYDEIATIAKQIAMHIAAAKPESLDVDSLDPAIIEREKQIFADQSRASGKPESIIEKMIEGRIRKFYEEAVLLEQVFVIDGKNKIRQVIEDLSKNLGKEVKIKSFVRFALGEGIEKQDSNFAEEVAAAAGLK